MPERSRAKMPDAFFHPFPHLKLINEPYPRLLATRRIVDDGSEYFGAFLNRTAVRILIDFINRTFRTRSCEIEIDGGFPVPCTQYYSRRCVAPCVESLCSRSEYESVVSLLRMFLRNDRDGLRGEMSDRIEQSAASLDFEQAASRRDFLASIEAFWSEPRWNVWLADSVDTYRFVVGETVSGTLLSQRGRRTLGKFTFELDRYADGASSLIELMTNIYRFHLPREIRVPSDFPGRIAFAKELGKRFGREVKITVADSGKLTLAAARAFEISHNENVLKAIARPATVHELAQGLRTLSGLTRRPKTVEAFDVAHISATSFVAASISKNLPSNIASRFAHEISAESSEPAALREFLARLLSTGESCGDILLIDGGATQMNAALAALPRSKDRTTRVVAAVKPPGRHSEISHFLTEAAVRVNFDARSAHIPAEYPRRSARARKLCSPPDSRHGAVLRTCGYFAVGH